MTALLNKKNLFKSKITNKGKPCFYVILGDEGIILIAVNKSNNVTDRLFFNNLDDKENLEKFKNLIQESPKYPIFLIIDTIDQNFQLQNFPPVSKYAIKSIAKKKLDRSVSDEFIKGLIQVSGPNEKSNEWHYLFVSLQLSGTLAKVLDILYELPNPFKSIRLLPIETSNLIKQILLSGPQYSQVADHEYQMLIIHNKVSGIRQILFKNYKVFFTRLINLDTNEYPDVIAGNINQEIKNSFEYLTRNLNIDTKDIGITIIAAEQVKKALIEQNEIKADYLTLTPYETAELLKITSGVLIEDKFCDIINALVIHFDTPVLPIHTNYSRKLYQLLIIKNLCFYGIFIFIIATLFYITNMVVDIINLDQMINERSIRLSSLQSKIQARKIETKIDSKENIMILESVNIFNNISQGTLAPNVLLQQFYEDSKNEARIVSAEWRTEKVSNPNSQVRSLINNNIIVLTLKLNFINTGRNYQDLFSNFDNFIRKIQNKFKNYQVEYSRISQQIGLDQDSNRAIPIDITIKGPMKK